MSLISNALRAQCLYLESKRHSPLYIEEFATASSTFNIFTSTAADMLKNDSDSFSGILNNIQCRKARFQRRKVKYFA